MLILLTDLCHMAKVGFHLGRESDRVWTAIWGQCEHIPLTPASGRDGAGVERVHHAPHHCSWENEAQVERT